MRRRRRYLIRWPPQPLRMASRRRLGGARRRRWRGGLIRPRVASSIEPLLRHSSVDVCCGRELYSRNLVCLCVLLLLLGLLVPLLVRELVKHVLNGLNGIRWTSMAGGIRAAGGGYSPAAACCHRTTSLSMLFRCGGLPHSVRRQLAVRIPEAHCNGQSSDFTPAFLQRLQSLRMVLPVSVGLQS